MDDQDDGGVPAGTRVYVYRNLRTGNFSVRATRGPRRGRVIAHADTLLISGGAEFWVSAAAQQRVRRTRRREVHAGVVGVADLAATAPTDLASWEEVTYNPFSDDHFVLRATGVTVHHADRAWFASSKVWIPTT